MTEKLYILHHHYSDHSGSGVLPFLVTEREKWVIEQVRQALTWNWQEIEFVQDETHKEMKG